MTRCLCTAWIALFLAFIGLFTTLKAQEAQPIPFNGGTAQVDSQEPNSWRYFRVVVPEGVDGWDVRITDVEGGDAQLVVRRDEVPDEHRWNSDWPAPISHPSEAISWPTGLQWSADNIDWTGRGMDAHDTDYLNRSGYRMLMPMGNPLEPGTYYVGVYTLEATPSNYTFTSRGIGIGQWYRIQEIPLETGSSLAIENLPPREASYYKISIPENTPSWEFTLSPTEGEMLMAVGHNTLPDFTTRTDGILHGSDTIEPAPVKLQKTGQERFVILPLHDSNGFVEPGDYYVLAISEGNGPTQEKNGLGTSSGVLTSLGPLMVEHLGSVSEDGITAELSMVEGQIKAFQFETPAGKAPYEILLTNQIGTFDIALVPSVRLPGPGGTLSGYGYSGGWGEDLRFGRDRVLFTDTNRTTYSLVVQCLSSDDIGLRPSVDLSIYPQPFTAIDFNDGSTRVENQQHDSWSFFQITVPEGVMGWDIRFTQLAGPNPYLMVRRDFWPEATTSTDFPWFIQTSPVEIIGWPSGNQLLFDHGTDWTGKYLNIDGTRPPQHVILSTGEPLNSGVYCLAVYNQHEEDLSFTLESRGIGENQAYPIRDLPFASNSSVTIANLPAREAEFFKVSVPPGTRSCEFELEQTQGELLMISRYGAIPDLVSDDDLDPRGAPNTHHRITPQRRTSRVGSERYVILPYEEEEYLRAGNYYFAIVSEGIDPRENQVGSGTSSGIFTCLGPISVTSIGPITTSGVTQHLDFAPGQIRAFQMQVSENITNLEIRLDKRVGNLELSLSKGPRLPFPHQTHWYGSEGGGFPFTIRDNSFISLPDPDPGIYSLVVRSDEFTLPGCSADLTIRNRGAIPLNFSETQNGDGSTHTDQRHLVEGQTLYYEVAIPSDQADEEVIGWILRLSHEDGDTSARVIKEIEGHPDDVVNVRSPVTVLTPPFLAPGHSYTIEIQAIGATHYTLSSEPVKLQHEPWIMPSGHNVMFADSGDGSLSNDKSLFVAGNDWHFFAIDVPPDGAYLMRTEFEAVEGNPRLFIREDGVPTLDHHGEGFRDPIYHRTQLAGIGNWVPVDITLESHLRPGRWYFGVTPTMGSGDARYRLRVSNGTVVDVSSPADLSHYVSEEQSVAPHDWTYYRFTLPWDAPTEWHLDFFNPSGDASMFLRNGIPPGNGTRNGVHEEPLAWKIANREGRHTYRTPKLRPGDTYYVGFSATTDAVVRFESSTSDDTIGYSNIPVLDFLNGVIDETLEPGASRLYRIPVPPDSNRVIWESVHSANVELSLEQGTLPGYDGDHGPSYVSFSADSVFYGHTYLGLVDGRSAWPWLPGKDYYLEIVNKSTNPEPIHLTMAGDNLSNHAPFIVAPVNPLTMEEDGFFKFFFISSDYDGDFLTYAIVDPPENGTATLGNMNFVYDYVTYTPDPDFFGTDQFSFKANDGELDSNIATFRMIVTNIPDPPVFETMPSIEILEDHGYRGSITATDADGDALTYRMIRGPRFGHANLYADGTFVYQPDPNFHGVDDFTARANDGSTDSNLATVSIVVLPVNDAPMLAKVPPLSMDQGSVLNRTLSVTDVDGDAVHFRIVDAPTNGTLSVPISGAFTYTPNPGFHGNDSFSVKANDGMLDSNVVTVSVTVNPSGSATDSWRELHFGTSENVGDASDLADPDGDGLMNLIEFAFGLNPTKGDIEALPSWEWTGEGFELHFTTNPGVAEIVSLVAEWTTDPSLEHWHSVADSGVLSASSFVVPKSDQRKLFVRIRATKR